MAAAAIAVVVAVVAALIWWTSDARATVSRPAASPAPAPTSAKAVPGPLRSCGPRQPKDHHAVSGGRPVVTGDGREVEGRDPATGNTRWSYARDLELCGVACVYDYAVAVYPDVRGCGQVSTINADRNARAQSHRIRRSRGETVLRRHHGAVGRGQPPGDVALGHGPDAVLRLARRPDQAGHSSVAGVPAGVGGGQRHRRLGAGGVPEADRSSADAAAARR